MCFSVAPCETFRKFSEADPNDNRRDYGEQIRVFSLSGGSIRDPAAPECLELLRDALPEDLAALASDCGYDISGPLSDYRAAMAEIPDRDRLLVIYSRLFLVPGDRHPISRRRSVGSSSSRTPIDIWRGSWGAPFEARWRCTRPSQRPPRQSSPRSLACAASSPANPSPRRIWPSSERDWRPTDSPAIMSPSRSTTATASWGSRPWSRRPRHPIGWRRPVEHRRARIPVERASGPYGRGYCRSPSPRV